jgi:hypothetical protein
MESTKRREILSRVAAGQLTPEEAAVQLEQVEAGPERAGMAVARVRIVRQLGSIRVVGDPSVRDAVAEGPHAARHEGDTLVIESEHERSGGFVFGAFPGRGQWGGSHFEEERDGLTVRMNPSLGLELDVQAGSCTVRGVEGPIRADVQAGSVKIDGLRGPLQASVQAGSLKAAGVLSQGASRISCEAGSVKIDLERGSSVRISAHSTLGKVSLPGAAATASGRGLTEVTVGTGLATLQIESAMGSVSVSAEQ